VRATGVEELGEVPGSGYRRPPALVRRADGQVLTLTPLLQQVFAAIDGRRSVAAVAEQVSASYGRAVGPDDHPLERVRWSHQLTRLLAHEIQRAMAAGVVTGAEADQLLARLVLVIDQAVESFP